MATHETDIEHELERAQRMVRRDRRQRWVYRDRGIARITTTPVPYHDAISVYWLPIQRMVATSYRPRAIAHSAIGAL